MKKYENLFANVK